MTNTLRLELFGGFRIAEGTPPLPGFTYSKGKALVAYLAVTGQPCGREMTRRALDDHRTSLV